VAALLDGGAGRAEGIAKHLAPAHGWGRAAGLAILAHWTPWRWRTALLAEEGAGLAGLAHLAAARAALGEPHGPAGSLLRRDVDDAIAEGLARWAECLIITDGDGAARIIRQGLSSEEPMVRAHAQEALEAVRSPLMARQVAGLHAPNGHMPPAAVAPDVLVAGASDWRHVLIAAAAGEEPNLPAPSCPTDDQMYRRDGTMLSLVERATLLRGVPPFADLSSDQLRLLAEVVEEVEIAAGETLVRAGGEGDHLYVVVAGQIALEERRGTSGSVARIGTLGPGEALGEDAVFDGGTHVLNATAQTDCQLLTLKRDVLLSLLDEQPALARTLIAWLSARLRETTGKLAERTRARPRSVIDLLDKMDDSRR
jgi:CRP-like cAMP-binding protein